ncbi:MAG: hypothetical protein COA54_01355 [Thiotrichaceae bacterium]|nr:MAG: hypothetical protein COA54_01355 [Thiotrichaceae bacterium]
MTNLIIETLNEGKSDYSLRLENSQIIDVETISESVICAAEYVASLLSHGLPKSIYQLTLFNLLAKQGFKLQIQRTEVTAGLAEDRQKEIIIVNELLVIECVAHDEKIRDSQRGLMFDNNSLTGIIVNFASGQTENPITSVYQNSVLH